MRQTIRQYMAQVKRLAATQGITDVEYQVNAWTYPQQMDSHIAIYRPDWPHDDCKLPSNCVRIGVVNSDCPGVLMRVANDEWSPRDVVREIMERSRGGHR